MKSTIRTDARSGWSSLLSVLLCTALPAAIASPVWAQQPAPFTGSIAFTSDRAGSNDIWVMDANGHNLRQLTGNIAFDRGGGAYDDFAPVWSPDGARIAFQTNRGVSGNYEIYVMNADGSGRRNITNNPALDAGPAWSADGRRIAFTSDRDGNWEIYSVDVNTLQVTRETNDPAMDHTATWSPDASRLAFSNYAYRGFSNILMKDMNGGGLSWLTLARNNNSFPDWSPDWSRIVFHSDRTSTGAAYGPYQIWVMDANGNNQTALTWGYKNNLVPKWSSDGQKIVFCSERDGDREIYTMNADGSSQQRRTFNTAADGYPDFGPNLPFVAPSAPTIQSAKAGYRKATLSWLPCATAARYSIKRSLTHLTPAQWAGVEALGSVYAGAASVYSYVDQGLTTDVTYYYVVSAINMAGESVSSAEVFLTPYAQRPGSPTGLRATPSATNILLQWNPAERADTYTLKRSLVSNGPYTTIVASGLSWTNSTDNNVVPGQTYYYVVSGTNSELGEGPNSTEVAARLTVPPPPGTRLAATAWPKFHADLQNTGNSTRGAGATNTPRWLIGDSAVQAPLIASPALGVNDRVYIVLGGKVYARRPSDGMVWSFTPPRQSDVPAVSGHGSNACIAVNANNTVYVVMNNGLLYALQDQDGSFKLNWTYNLGTDAFSSPTIGSDGMIYVGGGGAVWKLQDNGGTPTLKWRFECGDQITSSPTLSRDGKTLYFGASVPEAHRNGCVFALRTDTTDIRGQEKWRYVVGEGTGRIESSPAVGPDDTIYVGSTDGKLYALTDGGTSASLKWFPVGPSGAFAKIVSSPAVHADREGGYTIYVKCIKYDNRPDLNPPSGCLLAVKNGTPKWQFPTAMLPSDLNSNVLSLTVESSPAIDALGIIYVGAAVSVNNNQDRYGIVYALRDDGSRPWKVWEFTDIAAWSQSAVLSSPAVGLDGTIYIGGADGALYAIK